MFMIFFSLEADNNFYDSISALTTFFFIIECNLDYKVQNKFLITFRFDNLCEKAQELTVEDDNEVDIQLRKFIPFSKDDVETLSHIKVTSGRIF